MASYLKSSIIAITFFLLVTPICLAGPSDLLQLKDIVNVQYDPSVWDDYQMNALFGKKGDYSGDTAGNASDEGLDYGKAHKYLGYTTILLAGIAAVSSGNKDVHYGAAYSAVAAAAGTVFTGYMEHGDRFTFEDGLFTEDNSHILLGTIGALGCAAAVILADSDGGHGHNGIGVFGGAAMALSVITIKW